MPEIKGGAWSFGAAAKEKSLFRRTGIFYF